MQNDFGHPDGSLFVEGGDQLVKPINDEIAAAAQARAVIVVTQDWHPATTPHFIDDDGLDPDSRASAVIRKGTNGEDGYSAFSMREPGGDANIPTGLAGLLRERGIERVVVCGIATDVCVSATALSATKAGFNTTVLWDSTRPVYGDNATTARVLGEFGDASVTVIGAPA
jgi:nicotinamidase/pyrazinamidase